MASPIPHNWQVPKLFRDRMGAHAGRQRCMSADGHLLLVLHDPPDPSRHARRDAKLFWREPSGSWHCSAGGPPTVAPLRAHVDAFLEIAAKHEATANTAVTADDWYGLVLASGPLMRLTRNLADALQDAREAGGHDHDLITVRDNALDAARAFELLYASAREGLEYTLARRSEEQARQGEHMLESAHRLNLIAAVFLPATAIATIFGMNFRHGLEGVDGPWLFWLFTAVALMCGVLIRATLPRPPAATPIAPPRAAVGKAKPKAK